MSNEIVKQIVETRLYDNWVLTEVGYENIRFKPKRGIPFISVVVSENVPNRKSFKCKNENYSLMFEVRVPKNTGTSTINSYVEELIKLFEGYEEGLFRSFKGYADNIGITNQWFQKNVIFECKYKQVI